VSQDNDLSLEASVAPVGQSKRAGAYLLDAAYMEVGAAVMGNGDPIARMDSAHADQMREGVFSAVPSTWRRSAAGAS
jgi:hypothetical protein